MKTKVLIYFTLVLSFALTLLTHIGFSQNKSEDIIAGKKIKIFSKIINEERDILISLPYGYGQSKRRYPVVYILDGSEYRVIASGGMMQYFGSSSIPQVISVYLPNTDRGRDMTISDITLDQLPNIGKMGGENFLKFITEELIPHIDGNYQTTNYRVLAGYSSSGGFAIYAFISKPEFFNACIAASPSFFFENVFMGNLLQYFRNQKILDKTLYISYYDRDIKSSTLTFPVLDKIIKNNLPKLFKYRVKQFEGYSHVPPTSLYDGLIEIFKDWKRVNAPEIIPNNGLLHTNVPISVEIRADDTEIRYTLDGTEPTRESLLYLKPIIVSNPVNIKAKSFRGNLGESEVANGEFKPGHEFIPEESMNNLKSGLKYKYFERMWYILPDTLYILPTKSGITTAFNIKDRNKDEGFMFEFEGLLKIERDGLYRFYLLSRATSRLFLCSGKIINNEPRSEINESSYALYLKAGYYPVRALYTNAWYHGEDFVVSYDGPGIKKQGIPASMLFHTEK